MKIHLCSVLGSLGRKAESAQELILGVLRDEAIKAFPPQEIPTLAALVAVGSAGFVIPVLEGILEDYMAERLDFHIYARNAAQHLGNFPEHAARTVPFMLRALRTRGAELREGIAIASAKIGATALPLVEELLDQASNPRPLGQTLAYETKELGYAFAGVGPTAFPLLKTLLEDTSPIKRTAAVLVIEDLAPRLCSGMPQEGTRHCVPRKIPREWFPLLKTMVFDLLVQFDIETFPKNWVHNLVRAITAFGQEALGSVLRAWINCPKHRATTQWFLKDNPSWSVPQIIDLLRARPDLRPDLVKLLGLIGGKAESALPALRELAESATGPLADQIAEAINEIDHPQFE